MKRFLFAFALMLSACTPPASDTDTSAEAPPVDPAIASVVEQAMPGVVITGGAADDTGEFEVTGTLSGQEYKFDLLGPDGGWRVVQIQREIVWADAPAPVRDLIATSPIGFLPERVIESRQPADGSVIYILSSSSASEAVEVRYLDGAAAIMPPAH